jgi:hypothetical protein
MLRNKHQNVFQSIHCIFFNIVPCSSLLNEKSIIIFSVFESATEMRCYKARKGVFNGKEGNWSYRTSNSIPLFLCVRTKSNYRRKGAQITEFQNEFRQEECLPLNSVPIKFVHLKLCLIQRPPVISKNTGNTLYLRVIIRRWIHGMGFDTPKRVSNAPTDVRSWALRRDFCNTGWQQESY